MSDPQLLAEIFPTVIAHIQGAPMAQTAHNLYPPGSPIEITPGTYEIRTVGVDDRPTDPDRAAHEISPDDWHASVGVATTNCPYCNEETAMTTNRSGEGGSFQDGTGGGNDR